MRRFAIIILALSLAALLGACAPSPHSGKLSWPGVDDGGGLILGETTREAIYHAYGPPQSIVNPSSASRLFFAPDAGRHPRYPDAEVWSYSGSALDHARALDPRPVVLHHLTLRLYFDQQGILRDYSLLELKI